MKGFVKLYRKLLDWEWYTDANTVRLFVHCLLCANHRNNVYRGFTVKRGSFITGRKKLARELELSESQIRTALSKLKSTGEIVTQRVRYGSLVTLCNWGDYQFETRMPPDAEKITLYGRYINVGLTQNDYDAFVLETGAEGSDLIEILSEKIAAKQEPLFDEDYPHMHYVRLLQFWRYKRANPAKFRHKNEKGLEQENQGWRI